MFLKYSPDYEIKILSIPKEKIITNDIKAPKIEVISQDANFKPLSYKRVYIKDLRGNLVKSFPINVQTKIYKEVIVANDLIAFGQNITKENTKLEKKEISRYINQIFTIAPENTTAKRNLQKGDLILTNCVKSKPVVLKNSLININFITNKGIEIKMQGRALKDGAVGEVILVKSDKYNKTYSAIVNSTTNVTVRI